MHPQSDQLAIHIEVHKEVVKVIPMLDFSGLYGTAEKMIANLQPTARRITSSPHAFFKVRDAELRIIMQGPHAGPSNYKRAANMTSCLNEFQCFYLHVSLRSWRLTTC